jgi:AcrR family transcriptional regulator
MSAARPPRGQRADAARNERRLLEVAAEEFARDGADVPTEQIASRAGVGVGTLYRHFPTRRALLAAVMADRFRQLAVRAEELASLPDPGQAVRAWLAEMVATMGSYEGLGAQAAAIIAAEERAAEPCAAMHASFGRLVYRAKQAGQLRRDVSVEDLLLFANCAAWGGQQVRGGRAYSERLLALMLEGIQPGA